MYVDRPAVDEPGRARHSIPRPQSDKLLAPGSHTRFETIRAILRALNVEIALRTPAPLTDKSGEARKLSIDDFLPKKGGRPKAAARKAPSQLAAEIVEGVKTNNP